MPAFDVNIAELSHFHFIRISFISSLEFLVKNRPEPKVFPYNSQSRFRSPKRPLYLDSLKLGSTRITTREDSYLILIAPY